MQISDMFLSVTNNALPRGIGSPQRNSTVISIEGKEATSKKKNNHNLANLAFQIKYNVREKHRTFPNPNRKYVIPTYLEADPPWFLPRFHRYRELEGGSRGAC